MLADRFVLGSRQPPIAGSPAEVADALQAWVAEADVDGFNLSRTVGAGVLGGGGGLAGSRAAVAGRL